MKTSEAITRFLSKCKERGLSSGTIYVYGTILKHFDDEYPELPLTTPPIEKYLQARGETPKKRGKCFKVVQAFYSYLAAVEGIPSPVPPSGKVGRPPKKKLVLPDTQVISEGASISANAKLVRGGPSASNSTSTSTTEAVNAFLVSRRNMNRRPRTLLNYQTFYRDFIAHFPILPFKPEPIEKYLARDGWSAQTRVDYFHYLKVLYRWLARRRGLLNVMELIDAPQLPHKLRRVLTRAQLLEVLALIRTVQEKAVIYTLIDTKCRLGELLSMTREKIFPDHAIVIGKRAEREVPLSSDTYLLLSTLVPSGPLFLVNGKRMSERYCEKLVHEVMARARLTGEKLNPHILRHSMAVQHIVAGGDLLTLQKELGHTRISQTAVYAELAEEQVKEKHQQLNLLGKLTAEVASNPSAAVGPGEQGKVSEEPVPGPLPPGSLIRPRQLALLGSNKEVTQ